MLQVKLRKRQYTEQRSPTLNTMLMVEEVLMNAEEVLTIPEIKERLPKQVMHQTLMQIIDYLEYSGKIVVHNNKVLWTFNPESKLKTARRMRIK